MEEPQPIGFKSFKLSDAVMAVLDDVGYEAPTPIQERVIPLVLEGKDVLGQAQTGTGKTAAFALPLLSRIDLRNRAPQVLVLTPTRELAIQVAEAFQRYAGRLNGFHVVPIYGGQAYEGQLRQLRRGVHVVVGTPGRLMDHIRRDTLHLDAIESLVLDEADEMLRMGFLEDVEWILEQLPRERQTTLFSATLPKLIRGIAKKYMKDPHEIMIESISMAAQTVRQRYWMVGGIHKLDALTRILEAETFDGMMIFVRTKNETEELARKLEARGFAAEPINGDIPQKQRERTIERLKDGKLDILVATDVAARGLDVGRVSHVINYDIPYDPEAYVHRIGRTGRAGRKGDAILFVAPRERRMLHEIQMATRQKLELLELPTTESINDKRVAQFKQRITDMLEGGDLALFNDLVEQYRQEHDLPAIEIAGALAKMVQGDRPLLLKSAPEIRREESTFGERERGRGPKGFGPRGNVDGSDGVRAGREPAARGERERFFERRTKPVERPDRKADREEPRAKRPEHGMERFRIQVGQIHGVKPGHIVGAIANEAGLRGEDIGWIGIYDDYSTVDLPEGMPREIFQALKKVWVSGQQMRIARDAPGKAKRTDAAMNREAPDRAERPGSERAR